MKKRPYYDTCSCLSYWTVCGSAIHYGSSDNGAGRLPRLAETPGPASFDRLNYFRRDILRMLTRVLALRHSDAFSSTL
jgi:hypothetical protein